MTLQLVSIVLIHIVSFFIISAMAKFCSFKSFIQLVDNFNILPFQLSVVIGAVIPVLELSGAVLILINSTRVYGSFVIILLLMMFSYAVFQVLWQKRRISCGCYGRLIDAEVDAFTIGKIIYFLILVLFITISDSVSNFTVSFPVIIVGTTLTILVLVMQKLWQRYNETISRLQKLK